MRRACKRTPAEREMRRYCRTIGAVAVPALLGLLMLVRALGPVGSSSSSFIRRALASGSADGSDDDGSHHEIHACENVSELTSFDTSGGVVVLFVAIGYVFLGIAIICDDYFVEALEEIVAYFGIPEDVAGATFMAAGSSAPELATCVISTLIQPGDEGLGDVVGAAVFNSMTVVGLCAVFAGSVLQITLFPFVRDTVFYTVSILLLGLVVFDGKVEWFESLLLLMGAPPPHRRSRRRGNHVQVRRQSGASAG